MSYTGHLEYNRYLISVAFMNPIVTVIYRPLGGIAWAGTSLVNVTVAGEVRFVRVASAWSGASDVKWVTT